MAAQLEDAKDVSLEAYHGVIMITNRRFLFSPGIPATHNDRDPAKDSRIPVSDQNDCLAELFLKKLWQIAIREPLYLVTSL